MFGKNPFWKQAAILIPSHVPSADEAKEGCDVPAINRLDVIPIKEKVTSEPDVGNIERVFDRFLYRHRLWFVALDTSDYNPFLRPSEAVWKP